LILNKNVNTDSRRV